MQAKKKQQDLNATRAASDSQSADWVAEEGKTGREDLTPPVTSNRSLVLHNVLQPALEQLHLRNFYYNLRQQVIH